MFSPGTAHWEIGVRVCVRWTDSLSKAYPPGFALCVLGMTLADRHDTDKVQNMQDDKLMDVY